MICVTVGRTRHKQAAAEHAELGELGASINQMAAALQRARGLEQQQHDESRADEPKSKQT